MIAEGRMLDLHHQTMAPAERVVLEHVLWELGYGNDATDVMGEKMVLPMLGGLGLEDPGQQAREHCAVRPPLLG